MSSVSNYILTCGYDEDRIKQLNDRLSAYMTGAVFNQIDSFFGGNKCCEGLVLGLSHNGLDSEIVLAAVYDAWESADSFTRGCLALFYKGPHDERFREIANGA